MNFLRRKLRTPHIQELSTIQTYAFSAIFQHTIYIIWSTDVSCQFNMNAIFGDRSYLLQLLPLIDLTQVIVAFFLILFQHLRSWIHNNRTIKTINNYNVVLIYFG
ncbi:hypothetical protein D3C81_1924970 [compost metagenome]